MEPLSSSMGLAHLLRCVRVPHLQVEVWAKQTLSASLAINIYKYLPSCLIYIQYIDKLMLGVFWEKLTCANSQDIFEKENEAKN